MFHPIVTFTQRCDSGQGPPLSHFLGAVLSQLLSGQSAERKRECQPQIFDLPEELSPESWRTWVSCWATGPCGQCGMADPL